MMKFRQGSTLLVVAAMSIAAACAADSDARPPELADSADSVTTVGAGDFVAAPAGAVHFEVATSGNTARYRVREQLMGRDLPNDAVGETQQITGGITIDSTGRLIPGQSRFVVGTSAFKSDSDRRDGYVRRRLLEAERFPTVELVPTTVSGLPARLPSASASAGPVSLAMIGDLTVRGVTRPTTWRVTARQSGGRVTGTASTKFTFADFGISPPRVPIVLSVADTIALEYDFTLVRDDSAAH